MKRRYWLLAICCWLPPGAAFAVQDSIEGERVGGAASQLGPPAAVGPWSIGVWGGAARNSKFETRVGDRRRDLYMVGIRLGRQLAASPHFAFDFFVDVVPVIRTTNTPVAYRAVRGPCQSLVCRTEVVMETATVRGYGVTPFGMQVRAFPRQRIQLVIGVNLGAAWYDRPVPDPGEKRFNFMGDVVLGTHVRLGHSSAVLAGIRHNHTSNAGTGPANPGLDSRVVYLGATRSLGRRSQP